MKDLETINMRPIEDGLVIQNLRTEARAYLAKAVDDPRESRHGGLSRPLSDRAQRDRLRCPCRLALQAGGADRRRAFAPIWTTDAEVENVLLRHGRQLADFIFAQMMHHYNETPLGEDDYEVTRHTRIHVAPGAADERAPGQKRPRFPASCRAAVRNPQAGLRRLQEMLLSAPEIRLRPRTAACRHSSKPSHGREMDEARPSQFQIEYRSGEGYEPDFVVETKDRC